MKSSYTRKGKSTIAGLLDDGMKSVTRFYINRFKDTDTQVAIDLFLGRIEEYIEEDLVCNLNNIPLHPLTISDVIFYDHWKSLVPYVLN